MALLRWFTVLSVAVGCASSPTAPAGGDADVLVDPLSMPAEATVRVADVPSAQTCKPCHPRHVAEWSGSRHAFAMLDPVFQGLVGARHAAFDGVQDKFCVQCHSIAGVRGQEVVPGFSFTGLSPQVLEGVTCWSCHGAAAIARTHNAGLTMADDGKMRGNLSQPATAPHGSTAAPFLQQPEFCGACHEVVELHGLPLERPFSEWQDSPAVATQQDCASCHMPRYDGTAAEGGPQRTGLHAHGFVGLDPPGGHDADPTVRAAWQAERDALLHTAAGLTLQPGSAVPGQVWPVTVTVQNRIVGHSLPTGSTFIRQCWLELRVLDAQGQAVYETGTFDANGDLRDRWSALAPYGDADLVSFSSGFVDGHGEPTLFPWLATEHHRNQLRAGESRTYTYFVPVPTDVHGPLQVTARLRLRTYPPFLLRLLGLEAQVPDTLLADLAQDATTVTW